MDDKIANGLREEIMSKRSVQELQACLETTLRKTEDAEIEIGKHRAGNPKVALLRQLRDAYIGLASALIRSIESKMNTTICGESARINQERHEALMERVASENEMGATDGGSMTQRWNRVRTATERLENALHVHWNHQSTCQICLANRCCAPTAPPPTLRSLPSARSGSPHTDRVSV